MIAFGILAKYQHSRKHCNTGSSKWSTEECITVQQYRILSRDIWIYFIKSSYVIFRACKSLGLKKFLGFWFFMYLMLLIGFNQGVICRGLGGSFVLFALFFTARPSLFSVRKIRGGGSASDPPTSIYRA